MNEPIKILMLEDNESDAGLVRRALRNASISFEYRLVDTKEDYIKGLDEFIPDVIFSDHSLPQFNSLEAFEIYKDKNLDIPFILVTGTVSEEFAVTCLKQGVDDYIIKDHLTRLPTALKNALNNRKMASEKRQLEQDQISYIEKIKIQNKELIKINRELDRFVYSTSHELRAPLTSVMGIVYLIQSDIAEERFEFIEEYLQLINKSVDKMLHIIDGIMQYSHNKHNGIEKGIININELLAGIKENIKLLNGINQVEFKIHIDQKSPWYSDVKRIRMVLTNLISNSIIFSDKSKNDPYVFIDIEVNKENVTITIEDNGIGIHDKFMDEIFNMFQRGTVLSTGPGLGLYLVKETLEKLNGKIEVYSKVRQGTSFVIHLPNFIN